MMSTIKTNTLITVKYFTSVTLLYVCLFLDFTKLAVIERSTKCDTRFVHIHFCHTPSVFNRDLVPLLHLKISKTSKTSTDFRNLLQNQPRNPWACWGISKGQIFPCKRLPTTTLRLKMLDPKAHASTGDQPKLVTPIASIRR